MAARSREKFGPIRWEKENLPIAAISATRIAKVKVARLLDVNELPDLVRVAARWKRTQLDDVSTRILYPWVRRDDEPIGGTELIAVLDLVDEPKLVLVLARRCAPLLE